MESQNQSRSDSVLPIGSEQLQENDPRSQSLAEVLTAKSRDVLQSLFNRYPGEIASIEARALELLRDIGYIQEASLRTVGDGKKAWQLMRHCHILLLAGSWVLVSYSAYRLSKHHKELTTSLTVVLSLVLYIFLYVVGIPFVEKVIRRRYESRRNAIMFEVGDKVLSAVVGAGSALLSAYICLEIEYTDDNILGFKCLLYAAVLFMSAFKIKHGFVVVEVCAGWLLGILFISWRVLNGHVQPADSTTARAGYVLLRSLAGSLADKVSKNTAVVYSVIVVCAVFFIRPILLIFGFMAEFGKTHLMFPNFLDRYLGVDVGLPAALNTSLTHTANPLSTAKAALEQTRTATKGFPKLPKNANHIVTDAYKKALEGALIAAERAENAYNVCLRANDVEDPSTYDHASKSVVFARDAADCFVEIARILGEQCSTSTSSSQHCSTSTAS